MIMVWNVSLNGSKHVSSEFDPSMVVDTHLSKLHDTPAARFLHIDLLLFADI